jgi:hypothetical protein
LWVHRGGPAKTLGVPAPAGPLGYATEHSINTSKVSGA